MAQCTTGLFALLHRSKCPAMIKGFKNKILIFYNYKNMIKINVRF